MYTERERDRKRKNSENQKECPFNLKEFEHDSLSLSLSLYPPSSRPRKSSPPPPPLLSCHSSATVGLGRTPSIVGAHIDSATATCPAPTAKRNTRRNLSQGNKDDIIPAPFLWATNYRATIHNLDFLISSSIRTISGEFQCKKCEARDEIKYDLLIKFTEIANFICKRKGTMHDRAPTEWLNPMLPDCRYCQQKECMKPVISLKKRSINWLFLLLGQMLGCCTLEQLKYFCKHTKNHRTGAKDRVLYLTYLSLCKQLDPTGPFNP